MAADGSVIIEILGDDSKLKSTFTSLGKTAGTALKATTAAAASLLAGATSAVTALGAVGIDYNKQMETYTTNFEVMLGSLEAAQEKVNELKELGAKTPFELSDLADATQTLLAFNVSADESTGVITRLGDISLGNVQKLESLTRAYGKMNASQKVTLEDINMMIDAGFNPLLLVSEKTGETMEEVYARISDGAVSFEEIQEAIEAATSAGGQFYQGMEKASQTTEGMISTLKDNAQALVGEVFAPISESISNELLPTAIDSVERLTNAFRENGITGMIEAAGDIVSEAITAFIDELPSVAETATDIAASFANGISENTDQITDGAIKLVEAFARGIVELLPMIADTAAHMVFNLATYIGENGEEMVTAATETITSWVDGIIERLPAIAEASVQMIAALASGIIENIPELIQSVVELGQGIIEALLEVNWLDVGVQIIKGIAKGIVNTGKILVDAVIDSVESSFNAAKDWLGIHSPSTRARDEIGEEIPPGIGEGVTLAMPNLRRDVENELGGMMDSVRAAVEAENSAVGYGIAGKIQNVPQDDRFSEKYIDAATAPAAKQFVMRFEGDIGQLIRVLKPYIEEEDIRLGNGYA